MSFGDLSIRTRISAGLVVILVRVNGATTVQPWKFHKVFFIRHFPPSLQWGHDFAAVEICSA